MSLNICYVSVVHDNVLELYYGYQITNRAAIDDA